MQTYKTPYYVDTHLYKVSNLCNEFYIHGFITLDLGFDIIVSVITCFPHSTPIILVAILHHNVHQIQTRRIRWLILGICTFGILRCAHLNELILHALKSMNFNCCILCNALQRPQP